MSGERVTRVFIRDDDVGAWTPALERVMDFFCERGIAVAYQVIPSELTEEASARLCELRAAHPDLVALHQHGFEHKQEIGGEWRWTEFDGGRSHAEQREVITRGRALLGRHLRDHLDPSVFTPPSHKYDATTLDVLETLGFRVLSAGVQSSRAARAYYALGRALGRVDWLGRRVSYHGRALPGRALVELSAGVNVDEDLDRNGNRIEKDAARLRREFDALRALDPVVGIMLHHATYDAHERIGPLAGFIDGLRADPGVRFESLTSIAASLRSPALDG